MNKQITEIDGINIYKIDWDILEVLERIDCYDSSVLLKYEGLLNDYTAVGALSCGEIVDIYEIEL